MGDEQGRPASRAAEYDALFSTLPPAGSDAYWQRIEHPQTESVLPLEVLARCIRERLAAERHDHAMRIFESVMRYIDRRLTGWSIAIARTAGPGGMMELASELKEECLLKVWQELCKSEARFILENFVAVLRRIEQKTAQAALEKEGARKRPGVSTPTRIPRGELESIEAGHTDSDGTPVPLDIVDPAAEAEFFVADMRTDLQEVLKHIPQEDRELLYYAFVEGWTQQEIANRFHITDRTVRNRLNRILDTLRRYFDGGEGHHGE